MQLSQHAVGREDGGLQTAADGVIAAIVDAARGLLDLLGDFESAHAPRADGVGPVPYGGLHDLARYVGEGGDKLLSEDFKGFRRQTSAGAPWKPCHPYRPAGGPGLCAV